LKVPGTDKPVALLQHPQQTGDTFQIELEFGNVGF